MIFHPLSGMDAGFLYMETPTLHMHTLKVAVLRPPEALERIRFSDFRRVLERNLPRLPSFKQKLMPIPLGLTHPVWVWDEDFDLARHMAYRAASPPGGRQELNAIVSEIASKPLPRDRPLWEITMVDDLEQNRVAFVCKIHHSMADGAAALSIILELLARPMNEKKKGEGPEVGLDVGIDVDRRARSIAPTSGELRSELRAPTNWEITRWAGVRVLRRLASLPQLAWQTIRGLFALARRSRKGSHPPLPRPFSTPHTNWSSALSARRSFATTTLPLNEMQQIKRVLGATLNDVVLGVCGGALRAHLEEVEGQIPEKPLVASVPINTHPEITERTRGNHVGHLAASLCTNIADPVERVRTIHAMMDEAKQRQMTLGADLLERWVEFTPPKPYEAVVRFWSKRRMADLIPAPVNLVVSNVRGPSEPLTLGDTRLEAIYSVGPILEGIGLNLTGWSYGDQVCFVGLACPDQIFDIQQLVDRLPIALDELVQACVLFSVKTCAAARPLPNDEAGPTQAWDETADTERAAQS